LKRALELDSTNFAAAYNLGAAYLQQKNGSDATAAFQQCVTLAPDYAPGHRALGEMLLYQNRLDAALSELRRASELAPQDPSTHASLAKALSAKGLESEAEEERQKARPAGVPQ